jgi:hypothetical protein
MILTYKTIKNAILKKNYSFFTGDLNLNFIGIRNSKSKMDEWDDRFVLLWQENGEDKSWISMEFTTDAGKHYMKQELLSPTGCAILAPDQYKSLWTFGKHRGKYDAFIQSSPCKVYRDRNKDDIYDFDSKSLMIGNFGINLHHGYDSINVGANSAGCQVFRHPKHLEYVLNLAKKSAVKYGSKFTYTLINDTDI